MIHVVKCLPEFFEPLKSEKKTFEVRKKDRPYRVGDYLAVNEFIKESDDLYEMPIFPVTPEERSADGGKYSGKCLLFLITYILDDKNYCKDGMVILGLKRMKGETL